MKLFFVVLLLVIFAGPTVAKRFTTQPEPTKRSLPYRLVRRFGPVKLLMVTVLVVVVAPTATYLLLH